MLLNKIISSSTHFPANVMISFSIMTVQRVLTAELLKLIQSKNKKKSHVFRSYNGGWDMGKGKASRRNSGGENVSKEGPL